MKRNLILYVVLGSLAYLVIFFWRRINALKGIQVNTGKFKEVDYRNGFLTWVQEFTVNNPDTVSLRASKANIDVFVNGNYVGKCSLLSPQTIQANGISVINVNVVCTLLDIAFALGYTVLDLIKLKSLKLDLGGTIGAYGFTAPVKQSITFDYSQIVKIIQKL